MLSILIFLSNHQSEHQPSCNGELWQGDKAQNSQVLLWYTNPKLQTLKDLKMVKLSKDNQKFDIFDSKQPKLTQSLQFTRLSNVPIGGIFGVEVVSSLSEIWIASMLHYSCPL